MYFHVSTLTISMRRDTPALVSTPLYTHQLPLASLALAGGYARFSAMTYPFVLSLSLRMTLCRPPTRRQRNTPGKSGTSVSNASTTLTGGIPIT